MLRSVAVLGVDGWHGGWVGAEVEDGTVRWHVGTARELLEVDADAVGIDIPIGLPDRGTRPCDVLAKARLGKAAAAVFWAPPRAALAASTHAEAVLACKAHDAPGMSRQAWGIVPKITEVDSWMVAERQRRVVEVHPELSFRALDARVADPKRTARGVGQRLRALALWADLGDLADVPGGVGLDDALDALAASWSAARWREGAADVLGGERDAHGLRMRIAV